MRFDEAERRGSEYVNVDLSGVRLRNVDLTGAKVMEAMLVNARFSGLIEGLVVNDIEVAPLIEAELDRRYPERLKLRPSDAAGVREAWSVIEDMWAATKQRVNDLPEAILHERVDDEWSCAETFRHLVFVTDGWISGAVLGRTNHHHPFGMPPSYITDPERFGIEVDADPSIAEVIAAREDRMATVRGVVDEVTDEDLERACGEQGQHTVLSCLHTLFDEEWAHNQYANRDLDIVTRA
ncbi:DinB family protein [Phytoactinopolyspora endophytica]|uniref:DinB family protein n=1 Tax=Phytoactinopolyspora endophytica TaxID=1642495 RepID=UPI00101D9D19|nr:DinB family protein [Phytoactinopolyspora endophytica]